MSYEKLFINYVLRSRRKRSRDNQESSIALVNALFLGWMALCASGWHPTVAVFKDVVKKEGAMVILNRPLWMSQPKDGQFFLVWVINNGAPVGFNIDALEFGKNTRAME